MSTNNHNSAISRITIRESSPTDYVALVRVAGRDSKELPAGPMLVAEVRGEIHAAISIATGTVIADPFRRTADNISLLRSRREQLGSGRTGRRRALRIVAKSPALRRAAV